jgi:hypothetical protein
MKSTVFCASGRATNYASAHYIWIRDSIIQPGPRSPGHETQYLWLLSDTHHSWVYKILNYHSIEWPILNSTIQDKPKAAITRRKHRLAKYKHIVYMKLNHLMTFNVSGILLHSLLIQEYGSWAKYKNKGGNIVIIYTSSNQNQKATVYRLH